MTGLVAEYRRMGRPKAREGPMATVRITELAYERARMAAKDTGESIVAYVSRIVAERALADVEATSNALTAERKKWIKEQKKLESGGKSDG